MQVRDARAMVIRGGRLIDPATGRDEPGDIFIEDGRLVANAPADALCIDAAGLIVCPGLMDIHVHLREPGGEHKETIETGCRAAAAGGFTYVACMPNTNPPLDAPERIRYVLQRAAQVDLCTVGPIGTISAGRRGDHLADLRAMHEAGAVAFSDDGSGVEDDGVMHAAFVEARELGAVLIQHCEYREISAGGVMHLGEVSRRLGVPGLDPRSEEAMIERDIELCRRTGGRYHVAHISTAKAVDLVRSARREGLPVTAEVCTHHLVLTDQACATLDPNTKMHPPLRAPEDVKACLAGLLDGTIDCIVTDHAPHAPAEKAKGFLAAPPGIVGLETALALAAQATVEAGLCEWLRLIEWFTSAPARVLGMPPAALRAGSEANLTLIAPSHRWTCQAERMQTRSRNTPFDGWAFRALPVATIRQNRLVLSAEDYSQIA